MTTMPLARHAWSVVRPLLVACLLLMLLERFVVFRPIREGDWQPTRFTYEEARFRADDGTSATVFRGRAVENRGRLCR